MGVAVACLSWPRRVAFVANVACSSWRSPCSWRVTRSLVGHVTVCVWVLVLVVLVVVVLVVVVVCGVWCVVCLASSTSAGPWRGET